MSRSIRKGPYVETKLLSRIQEMNESGSRRIVRTWSRRSMIVPEMVGHNLHVYNGKLFMPIFVTENMVGHRLGEFAPTRKFSGHAGDKRLRKR
jgi:small subunit ribosomal protein S19